MRGLFGWGEDLHECAECKGAEVLNELRKVLFTHLGWNILDSLAQARRRLFSSHPLDSRASRGGVSAL